MYRLLRPLLFRLEAETAHRVALGAAAVAAPAAPLLRRALAPQDDRLVVERWGLRFPNPVGLAAGLDKDARHVHLWGALGFGFCEVGSVTARPSRGNPRPRAFRLPEDRALVNRMGLNNAGAEAVAARLAALRARTLPLPLAVNVAKTHDPTLLGAAALDDFAQAVYHLAPWADLLTLNVSCPNTAEGKTFEEPDALDALLRRVMAVRAVVAPRVPVLVKLSPPPPLPHPDFGQTDELVAVALAHRVAGFVATNTASDRHGLRTPRARLEAIGPGGLSGRPLADRAEALVRHLYRSLDGAVPIIGVGGIDSAEAAYRRLRAGASLLQLYTGLVYEGPTLPARIARGLLRRLERDGLPSVEAAIGLDA